MDQRVMKANYPDSEARRKANVNTKIKRNKRKQHVIKKHQYSKMGKDGAEQSKKQKRNDSQFQNAFPNIL